MKSIEIRKKFLDFFQKNGHKKIASSSLIPAQDPTLLFTNAGMNQFKDIFLGKEKRSYKRAVTIQKCMRAGGKHNDLENVGFTKRHLTFFEMMGNFSFGDYFKKETIQLAWDFLTKKLNLDKQKIYATVYKDDEESYNIWKDQIKLPECRIYKLGAIDNFWQMGDTGPCGPCSEILIDRGPETGCRKKSCKPGCFCDRFLEVWNLVFMEFNRQLDGKCIPLKQKGIDTGMGLERLCMIVSNKNSVFQTDLFTDIIDQIEKLTNLNYAEQSKEKKAAFHVLADHIRASCFLIADGCAPSNEGRGYVLRKIIRRAELFSQKLTDKNIFDKLAITLIDKMKSIYPELEIQQTLIIKTIESEIKKFASNLLRGQTILEKFFLENKNNKILMGDQIFRLYDTFGFPLEITKIIAEEKGFKLDITGFKKEMEKQKLRSGKKIGYEKTKISDSLITKFTGYEEYETDSKIIAIIHNNKVINQVRKNQECWIIPEKTPFYVECGGQIGDKGFITINDNKIPVKDLKKINNAIALKIKSPIEIKIQTKIKQTVLTKIRLDIEKNHTATHLLQAALMKIFGKQIKQSGSLVTPDYLRFDFTYPEKLSSEEIKKIEKLVNNEIQKNIKTKIRYSTLEEAISKGVIAFFGEKYSPEAVRIVEIPGISAELCGGTHVKSTGEIGCFKITEANSLSAGHKRIFAVTGSKAIELFQETYSIIKKISQELKVAKEEIFEAVIKQKEINQKIKQELKKLKKDYWKEKIPSLLNQLEYVNLIPFLFVSIKNIEPKEMKELATSLAEKKPGLYFLINNKNSFLSYLSPELKNNLNLKKLIYSLNLHGGGNESIIQGGGPEINKSLKEKIILWLKNLQSS